MGQQVSVDFFTVKTFNSGFCHHILYYGTLRISNL